MVEFGLKLEDNKVEEWSDKYIDYEKLKSLIKKAKRASEAVNTLSKRRPEIAAEVKAAYEGGASFSRQTSVSDMSAMWKVGDQDVDTASVRSTGSGQSAGAGISSFEMPDNKKSEQECLLDKNTVTYGSPEEMKVPVGKALTPSGSDRSFPLVRTESGKSLSGAIERIKGYLRGNYAIKLSEALRDTDVQVDNFSQCVFEELEKVNTFYKEKVDEHRNKLDVLVESVEGLGMAQHSKSANSDGGFTKLKSAMKKGFENAVHLNEKKVQNVSENLGDYLSDDEADAPKADEKQKAKVADSIKRALIDQHRTTTLLVNFSIMNYTGFVKIIKKFNKTFPEHKGRFGDVLKKDNVCHEGKEAEQLANHMEKLFADWFCDMNLREARAQMLPKKGDGLQMDWSQLRLGYRLGMCSILAVWVCWDCIWGLVRDGNTTIGGRTAFPVFRACGGLLLLHWFWGFSVYIWSRYRINYIFLFDFDPRIVDTPIMIFNDCVDETLVFLLGMLLYYKSGAHDIPEMIPAGGYPFLLVLFTIWRLIFPWRTRAPLWKAIFRVITAPVTSPIFFHIYVADVFTSMVKVFQDIMWTLCFVISGDFLLPENLDENDAPHPWQHAFWYKNVVIPLICLFPLWIRFNQCLRRYMDTHKRWPNLANAFKYALSQTVTLFGAFHPLYLLHVHKGNRPDQPSNENGINLFQTFWMGLFITSSLYSFLWDVYMDWGLGRPRFAFLGPRLMFPRQLHYYGVMVIDLVLRSMWVLTLVPPQSGASFEIPQYLTAVTMSLELLRRTLWGFFRLEHEHRHNTEGYRRIDFVPLHFNTGHSHKYKKGKEHVGWQVLVEVLAVSAVVIAVSITSVIAAQSGARKSNRDL